MSTRTMTSMTLTPRPSYAASLASAEGDILVGDHPRHTPQLTVRVESRSRHGMDVGDGTRRWTYARPLLLSIVAEEGTLVTGDQLRRRASIGEPTLPGGNYGQLVTSHKEQVPASPRRHPRVGRRPATRSRLSAWERTHPDALQRHALGCFWLRPPSAVRRLGRMPSRKLSPSRPLWGPGGRRRRRPRPGAVR